jgi:hypothetical protein
VGVNVTPANWDPVHSVLQVGADGAILSDLATGASTSTYITQNAYYDDTDNRWEYIGAASNEATRWGTYNGLHRFSTAVAGTADNAITWLTTMNISAAGEITAPLQPAFLAYPASNQNDFAIDAEVTVVLGTEAFDQGGDFASNTFTAPVTGKYQFNFFVYLVDVDSAADYYRLKLITTGRTYYYIFDTNRFSADVGRWTIGFSTLTDMLITETAYLSIYQSGGTQQTDISTNAYFSGHLVC